MNLIIYLSSNFGILLFVNLLISSCTYAARQGDVIGPTIKIYIGGSFFTLILHYLSKWHPWTDSQVAAIGLCFMLFIMLRFISKKRGGGANTPIDDWNGSIEEWQYMARRRGTQCLILMVTLLSMYFGFTFSWIFPPLVRYLGGSAKAAQVIGATSFCLGLMVTAVLFVGLLQMLPLRPPMESIFTCKKCKAAYPIDVSKILRMTQFKCKVCGHTVPLSGSKELKKMSR